MAGMNQRKSNLEFKVSPQILRVSDQNGVSQARYIVEIHHSGRKPSICKPALILLTPDSKIVMQFHEIFYQPLPVFLAMMA